VGGGNVGSSTEMMSGGELVVCGDVDSEPTTGKKRVVEGEVTTNNN